MFRALRALKLGLWFNMPQRVMIYRETRTLTKTLILFTMYMLSRKTM